MTDTELTAEQKNELIKRTILAAKGDPNRKSTKEDKEAEERLTGLFNNLIKTQQFGNIVQEAKGKVRRHQKKKENNIFEDAVELIGEIANWLYETSDQALTEALKALCEQDEKLEKQFETLAKIMRGILYALCLVAAVIAVVTCGIIAFTIAVIAAAIEGVWYVIKEVTGFVWKAFVASVKSPFFWGTVAAAGAGIAFLNPFIGAIVGGIGVIGTVVTLAVDSD